MSATFKLICILLLCFSITLPIRINAQGKHWSLLPDSTQKSIGLTIKTDVSGPIRGIFSKSSEYSFGIEKSLTKRLSVQLAGSILNIFTNGDVMQTTYTEHEYMIRPEIRRYFDNSKKLKGLFLGLTTYFMKDNISQTDPAELLPQYQSINDNYNFIGAGLGMGTHVYFFKRFVLDAQIIVAYQASISHTSTISDNPSPLYTSNYTAISFADICIGYRF